MESPRITMFMAEPPLHFSAAERATRPSNRGLPAPRAPAVLAFRRYVRAALAPVPGRQSLWHAEARVFREAAPPRHRSRQARFPDLARETGPLPPMHR